MIINVNNHVKSKCFKGNYSIWYKLVAFLQQREETISQLTFIV